MPTWGEVLMNVGEMQRKLSLWAEQDAGRKFHGLFDLVCDMDWLRLAHDYVAQNAGSKTAGCDGLSMWEFDQDLEGNLQRLQSALQADTFVACPVRRVYIPKANGKVRPLGIPTIRDRIVQEAVRMVLGPIFEADFDQLSFGFRPNRCTMDAISHLMGYTRKHVKYFWAIEGDISAYFDTINHRKLMKLLRRRVKDEKLLDLIWKFLRAGVMERKLFKDTELGTPQGGIVSPLLANVYLHELDRFMRRYTGLSEWERAKRRRQGLANFAYARYADDFVVLCNGTKEQAHAMREELHTFLAGSLRLSLSLEKTKVTHLDDGFDFLGFRLQRSLGGKGVVTKLTLPDKAMEKHRAIIRAATSPDTHQDSFAAKILALNRIIGGWCRYYQYTSKAQVQFSEQEHEVFWMVAHWLGRKYKLTMPRVLAKYHTRGGPTKSLGVGKVSLARHTSFKARRYFASPFKPNPYTTQTGIEREELLDANPWLGTEDRPGMADLRPVVLERDGYRCRVCKEPVTDATAQVDHVLPVSLYKRPVDANCLSNLWTLCVPCHKRKTESDRQRESRVP
jgi:group II intron reverse transcriptase/maturase